MITSDIPLASQVIAKGALVLDSRGELMDQSNIEGRLTMRNFMEGLRNSGVDTGSPSGLSKSDVQAFANQQDRLLVKRRPSNP